MDFRITDCNSLSCNADRALHPAYCPIGVEIIAKPMQITDSKP